MSKAKFNELGLSKARFVRLAGYNNEAKESGDLMLSLLAIWKLPTLIQRLPAALNLPDEVIHHAVQETRKQLDDRKRRHWEARKRNGGRRSSPLHDADRKIA
jgi:hypothetical protein